jgi:hypothetical protein
LMPARLGRDGVAGAGNRPPPADHHRGHNPSPPGGLRFTTAVLRPLQTRSCRSGCPVTLADLLRVAATHPLPFPASKPGDSRCVMCGCCAVSPQRSLSRLTCSGLPTYRHGASGFPNPPLWSAPSCGRTRRPTRCADVPCWPVWPGPPSSAPRRHAPRWIRSPRLRPPCSTHPRVHQRRPLRPSSHERSPPCARSSIRAATPKSSPRCPGCCPPRSRPAPSLQAAQPRARLPSCTRWPPNY